MRIAIASDHAAVDLKAELREYLIELGHEVADLGPETADRVDYPDYGYKLAAVVADGTARFGVALCGSGIGISIAVNRNPACRAALVSEPLSAALAREHNDANVHRHGRAADRAGHGQGLPRFLSDHRIWRRPPWPPRRQTLQSLDLKAPPR
jgi:ribose 5-phosphate isomerase B